MKKFLILIFTSAAILFGQTWQTTHDLNISAGNNERLDIFSNAAGNHLVVETSSQINYYLYAPNGTLIRASTLDTHSENTRLSAITGEGDNVYVIYKKGSKIESQRSTDDGQTWTALTSVSMTYSTSDGIDAVSDANNAYMTWSEKQGSTDDYETYYMKIQHGNSAWQDKKEVTDEANRKGGLPSITLASGRVTVGFTDVIGDFGSVYKRELVNGSWQNASYAWNGTQGIFINDDTNTHLFTYEPGDIVFPPGTAPHYLNHYYTAIGTNSFNNLTILEDYGSSFPDENERLVSIKTADNSVHIVYDGQRYKRWNGSSFTDSYTFGNGTNNKISADGDDIYIVWIENGTVNLKQRDYNPSKLTSFAGTWSSSHPKVTWDESEATDFKEYVVEKSTDGVNFSTRATISSRGVTSYTDASEYRYSPGNTKSYVWYRTYQKDLQDNVSENTANKSFTVNGPQNSVNQLIVSTDIKLADFILAENYPNPFNPETKISFGLPEQSNVSLKVYNIQGQVVATLADGVKQDGYYTASFDGSDLSSGVYIYRFAARGLESGKVHNEIKRMLLIK